MVIEQQVHHPLVERNNKRIPGVMANMSEELAIQVYLSKYEEKYKLRKRKPTMYLPVERIYDLLILSNSTTAKDFNQFLCQLYKSDDLHAVELRNGKENFSLYMHPDIMFNFIKRKVRSRIRKENKNLPPGFTRLGEGSETPPKVSS